MPGCEFECRGDHEFVGLRDCCHTCTYFFGGKCQAPATFDFFPRVLWRIAREA